LKHLRRILAGVFVLSALSGFAQTITIAAAVKALRKAEPNVKWAKKRAVVADVTCDQAPDALVIGYEAKEVWLGVVQVGKRNSAPTTEIFSFPVCAVPVRIETVPMDCKRDDGPLPGCKIVKGCREFSLVDDACDSFHFYWDDEAKRLWWWRR
jgi:hypothetical protein